MAAKVKKEKVTKPDLNQRFLSEIRAAYPGKVRLKEFKDRIAVSIGGIQVAAYLMRAKTFTMRLTKFKPENTTLDDRLRRNLISYGAAGWFYLVDEDHLSEAVDAFKVHHDDLARVKRIREKGL